MDSKKPEQFEVRNQEIEQTMTGIGGIIGSQLPKGWGYTLFLYEFLPGEALFYISNGDREGNIKALERQLAMLKAQDQPGAIVTEPVKRPAGW